MFKQIRSRLVLLNAAVFFLILIIFSVLLYTHMRYRLLHPIDEVLTQAEQLLQHTRFEDTLRGSHPEPELDRHMVYLYLNSQGDVTDQRPKLSFTAEELKPFTDNLSGPSLHTVTVGGQEYRLLQVVNPALAGTSGTGNGASSIASILLVRSLEAENKMLVTLRRDIYSGIAAGLLIVMLAGYFLAGRALIPIRRSWDKQQQFVADASHELRTPTAVIQAHAELLLRHPAHTVEEESRNIAVILKESKRMGKLIEDLLTLARTDSDELQIQAAPMMLDQLAADTADTFRYLADTKEIRILTDIESPLPYWGDESRIRQLLIILLDNALKFTPAGGTIEIICRKTGNTAQLMVKDTGTGIAEEELPLIFERFYRTDKARSRSEGGTGLGLSIARWIALAHGGDIKARSERFAGTEMRVLLPLKKTSPEPLKEK